MRSPSGATTWTIAAPKEQYWDLTPAWYGIYDANKWTDGETVTLSLLASSTSSQNINFGYADNGGWLKFSVPAGASNSPITVTDTVKATTTRMEVRTELTNGAVTLAQVNMYRGCPTPSPTPSPTLSPTPLPSATPSAAGGARTPHAAWTKVAKCQS